MIVNKAVCLHLFCADISVKQIIECQERKQQQHPMDIVAVMQKQQGACIRGRVFHIMPVDFNQLAAVVTVFPMNAEKRFKRFLLTVWHMQERLVGGNALIQVDPLETVEIVRALMLLTFLEQIGKIEIVAIKMNQVGE